MKTSQAIMAALLGLLMTDGTASYAQSASGGGAGAASGGASATGGVAGSVGAGGVSGITGAGGVTGTRSSIGGAVGSGVGAPFGGDVGFGERSFGVPGDFRGAAVAGADAGFGPRNFGASASGAGRGFGTPPNRSGLGPQNPQRFNRTNQDPFSAGNRPFNQDQGSFNQNAPGAFSQDMQNQGAFGLGNGNRSSFFDNQPFNNQGFGQGTSGGAAANSDFTEAGDRDSFEEAETGFTDSTTSAANGGFTEAQPNGNFQNGEFAQEADASFDNADNQDPFRGQQFRDDESASARAADRASEATARTGPGSDRAFRDPSEPIGFHGAATPRVRSGEPATPPGLDQAFRDPSDPIGFNGAASARVRSSGIDRTEADQPGEDDSGVQPAAGPEFEDDRSFGHQGFNSTESSNNSFNDRSGRALGDAQGFDSASRTNAAVGNGVGSAQSFSQSNSGGRPVPSFAGTTQGTMSSTTTGGQANSSSGASGGGISSPSGAAGGVAQPWSFTNPPPPPTSGNGLWRPGGGVYGAPPPFPSEPPLPPASGPDLVLKNRPAGAQGVPTGSAGQRNPGTGGRDTTVPNSFNGAYSRRRL